MTSTFSSGLDVLGRIIAAELASSGAPGTSRLAEQLGIDQAQVSRMLKDLAELQLIEKDEQGRGHRVGERYFDLAATAGDSGLLTRARPLLRALVARWHEPAWLSVLSGGDALAVHVEASHWSSYVAATPGRPTPAWCTGPGRALLLDHTEQELAELLAGVDFVGGGPRAARNVADLASRNARDQEAGVVVADREFEHDVVDFSAPVRDQAGGIVAAMSVAVPRFRLAERAGEIMASVRQAAVSLNVSLATRDGWTTDRPVA
jgi:DNA-binding IclR family transcriptional regulator